MAYITKLNLDGAQYSVVPSIKKLNVDGGIYDIGLNTSDANSISSDIKQGKTAYVNGQKITGSLAPYGPQTITPITRDQSFGPGVYLNGKITVLGSTALIPGNIKSGVNIFGVVGNLESFYEPICAVANRSADSGWMYYDESSDSYKYQEKLSQWSSSMGFTGRNLYAVYAICWGRIGITVNGSQIFPISNGSAKLYKFPTPTKLSSVVVNNSAGYYIGGCCILGYH